MHMGMDRAISPVHTRIGPPARRGKAMAPQRFDVVGPSRLLPGRSRPRLVLGASIMRISPLISVGAVTLGACIPI
jgi:hypothetical protein